MKCSAIGGHAGNLLPGQGLVDVRGPVQGLTTTEGQQSMLHIVENDLELLGFIEVLQAGHQFGLCHFQRVFLVHASGTVQHIDEARALVADAQELGFSLLESRQRLDPFDCSPGQQLRRIGQRRGGRPGPRTQYLW